MAEETAGTRGSGPEARGQGLRACSALGWVALGGAAGTLVRAVVAVDVPRTLLVNVVGAFLLGLLLGRSSDGRGVGIGCPLEGRCGWSR